MSRTGTVTRGSDTAHFEVTGRMLKVTSVSLGIKSAQLGRTPPEILAGILLHELIMENERRDRTNG